MTNRRADWPALHSEMLRASWSRRGPVSQCAASATAGGVALPNGLPATAEAPFSARRGHWTELARGVP